jgi:GntR family transcriptional regulator, transcriptional repressor for pyruvate dehydrogenase complex
VREALRSLMSQNLVETTRGTTGGTFVAVPATGAISDLIEANLGLLAVSRTVSVEELLETREMLEVPAARMAAQRRSAADLDAFRVWLVAPESVSTDELFEANRNFHQAVVTASRNGLLDVVCRPIFGVLRTRFLRSEAPDEFWAEVDADHRDIADAIAARDGERAGELMQTHLTRLRGTYEALDRERQHQEQAS